MYVCLCAGMCAPAQSNEEEKGQLHEPRYLPLRPRRSPLVAFRSVERAIFIIFFFLPYFDCFVFSSVLNPGTGTPAGDHRSTHSSRRFRFALHIYQTLSSASFLGALAPRKPVSRKTRAGNQHSHRLNCSRTTPATSRHWAPH